MRKESHGPKVSKVNIFISDIIETSIYFSLSAVLLVVYHCHNQVYLLLSHQKISIVHTSTKCRSYLYFTL